MSEIQTISQGNYILATQQEVSHDNSLSGNGTVESPLGVVPGYNETVLWSGSVRVSTAQNVLNLSESLNNFQSFKIYDKSIDRANVGTRITEFESISSENFFGTEDVWVDSWQPTTEGCCYIGHNYYSANSARDKIVTLRSFYRSLPTTAAESTQNLGTITKVIGINRIANN